MLVGIALAPSGCKQDNLLVDSGLKGLNFGGLIEDIRAAVDKDVDIFDITHVEKGSKIDMEIQKREY